MRNVKIINSTLLTIFRCNELFLIALLTCKNLFRIKMKSIIFK